MFVDAGGNSYFINLINRHEISHHLKKCPNHADVLHHFNLGGTIDITVRDEQWIFKGTPQS